MTPASRLRRDLGTPSARALALFACAVLIAGYGVLLARAAGRGAFLVGPHGRPSPADFNCFWAAGKLMVEGRAHAVYAWPALRSVLQAAGRVVPKGGSEAVFPFYYPPVFLFWLAPLGLLPYAAAAWAWCVATLAAFSAALLSIGRTPLAAAVGLASPAVFACLYIGQNGLLSAALAGGGLALAGRRPLLAGVLLGLLAFKPQLGLPLPVLFLAAGHWRLIASAAATVLISYGLAGALFGWALYPTFWSLVAPVHGAGPIGLLAEPGKLQSLGALFLWLGLPGPAAVLGHAVVALGATLAAARLWRRGERPALQAAAAIAAMLITAPYCGLYDYPLLAIGMAFLLRDAQTGELGRAEALGLGAAFAAPFAAIVLMAPLCPLGAILLLAVVLHRDSRRINKVSSAHPHPNGALDAS